MAASVMNGRLRSISTQGGSSHLVSALPITEAKGTLSIITYPFAETGSDPDPVTESETASNGNNDVATANNSNLRGSPRTTAANVSLLHSHEGGVDPHSTSVAGNISERSIGIKNDDVVVVDHCWWDLSSWEHQEGFIGTSNATNNCCPNENASPPLLSKKSMLLAVLSRCNASNKSLKRASTSSSIVHLYFCTYDEATKTIINNATKENDGKSRDPHDHHHYNIIASFPISYHATGIAMGGKGLKGVLVIARSSGIELHSLQPILEHYLKGHHGSWKATKNDNNKSEHAPLVSSSEMSPKNTNLDNAPKEKAHEESEGLQSHSISHSTLSTTPIREPPRSKPITPLAPKSLSKAFEDVCRIQPLQDSPQCSLKSQSQQKSNSMPPSQINPPVVEKKSQQSQEHHHYHHSLSSSPVVTSPMIELLPSYCIHALHLSYPYLSIASGDRVGVWNVSADSLFGKDNKKNYDDDAKNTPSGKEQHRVPEALWATTLPSTISNSVHRRVTSIHMTSCGVAMAVSCWDGSAYVFVASNSHPCSTVDSNDDTTTSLSSGSLISSWDRVTGQAGEYTFASKKEASHVLQPPPIWEQPTNANDGMFPTFVTLKLQSSFLQVGRHGNALIMAVSTPGSSKIRCFDVFSGGSQCPDIHVGNGNPTKGKIHGMIYASSSISSVSRFHTEGDGLVCITENDEVHIYRWATLLGAKELVKNESELSSTIIHRMKRHWTRRLIAESKPMDCDGNGNKMSKAWLYWHKGNILLKKSSSANLSKHTSSLWAIQCQWGNYAKNDDPMVVYTPFLTESDVVDLVQNKIQAETKEHNKTDHYVRGKKTQAIISLDYLSVIVPSYGILYVYSREFLAWKMIDLQEDDGDVVGEDIINASASVKVILIDSKCFVLFLDERAEFMNVKVYDLGSIFKSRIHDYTALYHCSLQINQCESISTLNVQMSRENSEAFVVSCHSKKGIKEGLQIWEIECNDDEKSCVLCLEHFIASSTTFPINDLKPTSISWSLITKEVSPEHDALATIVRNKSRNKERGDLILHFKLRGSSWLYIPRSNLWRPL
mmetsp:Transcript_45246/g.94913  ORF Transcript_45246/g.94913 Transcript_45246/m.94913 type:complete len:1058 (-) Transcript_45246:104-3277(-)